MVPKVIISGGQTGADRGGLDAGRELGLTIGGYCPRGRMAEDGVVPAIYPLREIKQRSYTERTIKNIMVADATIVFTYGLLTGGSAKTWETAHHVQKPSKWINFNQVSDMEAAAEIRSWLDRVKPRVLNVAGNRESKAPGIAERVRHVLVVALSSN